DGMPDIGIASAGPDLAAARRDLSLGWRRRTDDRRRRPVHPARDRQHRAHHDTQDKDPGQDRRPPAAPAEDRRCIYSGIWVHIGDYPVLDKHHATWQYP